MVGLSRIVGVELLKQRSQCFGFGCQCCILGVGFFDYGCILLCFLVYCVNGGVDFFEVGCLFVCSINDGVDVVVDVLYLYDNIGQS